MTYSFPTAEPFDAIVIGAGINGAGIARDAAMRGLKVFLLDKSDIGSGTSSWSTRLIHGGLRYLEHGEFSLVRESLRERETLLRIAPHLVRPLPMVFPIYKGGKRGRTTVRAGMLAYDFLTLSKKVHRHRMLSVAEVLQLIPRINSNGLLGGALFYDAQVEFAERLVLENVLAAEASGAVVATYAEVQRLVIEDGRACGIEFLDRQAGQAHSVRARLIINASGPWVDQLLQRGSPHQHKLLAGTKGSHIVVSPFPGATDTAIYVEAQTDSRPFFIIPWNGNYLIGTTDIRYQAEPDEVRTESWEIDYLLSETNRVFPGAHLTHKQVLYTYAGVRPLAFTNESDEQKITRRHFIREQTEVSNLLSIVGGKLTTYRSLAEECVDLMLRKLGRQGRECQTADLALPGAREVSGKIEQFQASIPLSDAITDRLLRIYGARCNDLLQLCRDERELARTFDKNGKALAGEVVFAFEKEMAKTLTDCLLRRTMLGLNADLAIGDDERAAEVAARFLGWSKQRADEEVAMYRSYIRRFQQRFD